MKLPTFCRALTLCALPALTFLSVGCGGGSNPAPTSTPTPLVAAVTLSAEQTDLLRGQSTNLRWSAVNAIAVTESNFGAQDVSGSQAVTPLQTTTYSLTVRNAAGQTTATTTTVRVATVEVAIAPAPAVAIFQSLPLTAQVRGAVDPSVTWNVQEAGGGSISADGVYTAPATAGTYHVRAQSVADISKTAVVEVQVRAANGSVSVN